MSVFGFGKKKQAEETPVPCACGGMCKPSEIAAKQAAEAKAAENAGCCGAKPSADAEAVKAGGASVKVLGSGCAKCNALEAATVEALEALGMDTAIDHVTDFAQIAAYGVMTTPALVVDGKVVCYGKVLKKEQVITLLQKVRG
ncbi:MAG: thioredoxin family protein [Faecalibacterium sp.]|jgi:small redox-active disulfide protein 2|nr:thioredoxin family protein [Faecalibacterium sp.]